MDSTRVLIGLQVCFHSAMKHENDVSNVVDCLRVVRIYSFMKEVKVYIRASYTVFFFITQKIILLKKFIKHVLRAFIAWWKPRQCLRRGENPRLLSNSPRLSPRFHQAVKARRTCFISQVLCRIVLYCIVKLFSILCLSTCLVITRPTVGLVSRAFSLGQN